MPSGKHVVSLVYLGDCAPWYEGPFQKIVSGRVHCRGIATGTTKHVTADEALGWLSSLQMKDSPDILMLSLGGRDSARRASNFGPTFRLSAFQYTCTQIALVALRTFKRVFFVTPTPFDSTQPLLLEEDENLTILEPDWRIFWDTARDVMWRHGIEIIDLHSFSCIAPPISADIFTSSPAASVPRDSAVLAQAAYVFGRIERDVDVYALASDLDVTLASSQTRTFVASAFVLGVFLGVAIVIGRTNQRMGKQSVKFPR